MAKYKVDPTNGFVTFELRMPAALTISGGSCAGGLSGNEKIVDAEARDSVSTIAWLIPAEVGARYMIVAEIPKIGGIPQSQFKLTRGVLQNSSHAQTSGTSNPKTVKLQKKFGSGSFRYDELIELIG